MSRVINIHLILEYLAFFTAYRYYAYLRKEQIDPIPTTNRLAIILGAACGALIGSRIVAFLENPVVHFSSVNFMQLYNLKPLWADYSEAFLV